MTKLTYVPPPPENSTVYSILASAMRLMPDTHLVRKLCGGHCASVRPLWPLGLEMIADAMPAPLELDALALMNRHTLVPMFLPFMEEPRRSTLIKATLRLDAGEPYVVSGASASSMILSPSLRVCVACLRSCEPCWSRVAQAPGAIVCTRHPHEILRETSVPRTPRSNRRRYIDVRDAVVENPCVPVLSAADARKAIGLAAAMETLLTCSCAQPGAERFRIWLHERFRAAGFAGPFGKLKLTAATDAVSNWLGSAFSTAIGVRHQATLVSNQWLAKMLTQKHTAIHPLLATIPVLFLGIGIDEALGEALETGPHKRLNTTPMHRGISAAHARFEASKTRLGRLWSNQNLSVRNIGCRLHVRDITVRRWAFALHLHFPRIGPTKVVRAPRLRKTLPLFSERVRQKRALWLKAVGNLPAGWGASHHPTTCNLYGWLIRYCPTWLKANMPKCASVSRVDWAARDKSISTRIENTAKQITSRKIPARASRTRIFMEVGSTYLFSELARLPKCQAALRKYSEANSDFMFRVLRWRKSEGSLSPRILATALRKYPHLKKAALL